MDPMSVIDRARDALSVRRVFGEPYEKNGLTVIPVARLQGGGGGGRDRPQPGSDKDGEGASAGGGGFGLAARPVGVFVVRGDDVSFRPAVDVNRLVLGAQIVGIVALLTLRSIVKTRAKHRG